MAHMVGRQDVTTEFVEFPTPPTCAAEPRYLSIRRAIEERIADGTYAAGSSIPSEHELAQEFDTTRLTVRSAIDGLVAHGRIRRVQGKGAYVAQRNPGAAVPAAGFRSGLKGGEGVRSVRQLSKAKRLAGPWYAFLFGIDEADELYSIRRLNSINGTPVSLESTLVPVKLVPGIEDVDVSVFSLYETYAMCGREIACAQEKLDVVALSTRDAGLLQVEPGSLALSLECLSFDATGQPIEHAYALNSGMYGGYTYRY